MYHVKQSSFLMANLLATFLLCVILLSCANQVKQKNNGSIKDTLNIGVANKSAESNAMVTEETTWVNGIYYRSIRDTINLTIEEPDVIFFKQHYNLLYGLPDTLIREGYKSKTVKIWAMKNKKEDLASNWFEIYTYDDKGRLKYFFYSGCVICSQSPFEYNIIYTSTGNIEKIFDNKYSNRSYQFYYGEKDIIKKIEYFEHGILSNRITRII